MKRKTRPIRRCIALLLIACLAPAFSALALEPGEVALIANARVPASIQLAEFYARTRGVPTSHIIELQLPEGESISGERLDPDVVMPIRQALIERNLKDKIKCLVTFYGVPLKVTARNNRAAEQAELKELQERSDLINRQIATAVTSLESVITRFDPDFAPQGATEVVQMLQRADIATRRGQQLLRDIPEDAARQEIQTALVNTIAQLGGQAALLRHTQPPMLRSLTTAPATQPIRDPQARWRQMADEVKRANEEAQTLVGRRHEAASRARVRELTQEYLGLVEALRICQIHSDYLRPEGPNALDSELAMLWFNAYAHSGILDNPLNYRYKGDRSKGPPLMVTRLDGPETGTARDIVLACRAVEAAGGINGIFAIDSRGLPEKTAAGTPDGMGTFDQRLRDLAQLLARTKLQVVADDTPAVFPAGKLSNVALYCGWYSVRNYVPGMTFVPGAVGFHVASFEMISLRDVNERGWVRGLLNDGVAATLGPVDEPYLQTFPDPLDFFALLLTGKYTLAEVYWRTVPCVSWRLSLIGDPLYNPFKDKPILQAEDLPAPLKQFVAPPSLSPEHLPGYGF